MWYTGSIDYFIFYGSASAATCWQPLFFLLACCLPGDMHAYRRSVGPCVNCSMQNISGLTWPESIEQLPPLTYIVHRVRTDRQKLFNNCHGSRMEGKFAASTAPISRVPVMGYDETAALRSAPPPLYIYQARGSKEYSLIYLASAFWPQTTASTTATDRSYLLS
jgi:hypothetical protein